MATQRTFSKTAAKTTPVQRSGRRWTPFALSLFVLLAVLTLAAGVGTVALGPAEVARGCAARSDRAPFRSRAM